MEVLSLMNESCSIILSAAVAAIPLFVIVGATTLLGRRWLSPWKRHVLWSLVLVRLVLPTSIASPISLQNAWLFLPKGGDQEVKAPHDMSPPVEWALVTALAYDEHAVLPAPDSATRNVSSTFTDRAQALIPSVLMVGSMLLAFWSIVTTIRLMRLVRRGTVATDPDWIMLLEEGCRAFGVRTTIELRIIPGWTTPATMGWWRPQILLPEDAASLTVAERRHIIWHELAHIRRWDAATSILLAVARCLHWWNPLFWFAQRSWLAERELACDALVIRQLGATAAADYGHTLLNFVERTDHRRRWISDALAPGLVTLIGAKSTLRRRLQELMRSRPVETAWSQRITWALITGFVVVGLTDAASPQVIPNDETTIGLPGGTSWRVSTATPVPTGPLVTMVYDLTESVARLRRDDPELNAEIAAVSLRQSLLQSFPTTTTQTTTVNPADAAQESKCVLDGQRLIVRATESQQQVIQNLLTRWRDHGQRQICIEVQFLSTPKDLNDLLSTDGGEVITAAPVRDARVMPLVTGQQISHVTVPAFVRVLNAAESQLTRARIQSDARSNIFAAPTVTVFDGTTATVFTGEERPFVTGLRSLHGGGHEPQITVQPCGLCLQCTANAQGPKEPTLLHVLYRRSDVVRVETLKIRTQPKDIAIQIPHLSESLVESTTALADGETLLVAPLRRDERGHLHLCLVTPRVLDDELIRGH